MLIDRKVKNYKVVCPACKKERYVTYAQNWNIEKGNSTGDCYKCRKGGSIIGLEKGRGWNKGLPIEKQPRYGVKMSEETKNKLRIKNIGRKMTKADKLKMRIIALKRKVHPNTGRTWKVKDTSNMGLTKGKKHWNWKGGKTPYLIKLRNSTMWKKWREAVFARDDYTCLSCKKRGCEIHPHHINSFINYPKYRFDITNGVTLCKQCHYLLHSK